MLDPSKGMPVMNEEPPGYGHTFLRGLSLSLFLHQTAIKYFWNCIDIKSTAVHKVHLIWSQTTMTLKLALQ